MFLTRSSFVQKSRKKVIWTNIRMTGTKPELWVVPSSMSLGFSSQASEDSGLSKMNNGSQASGWYLFSCFYIIPRKPNARAVQSHLTQSDLLSVPSTGSEYNPCICQEPFPQTHSFLWGLCRSATFEVCLRKWEFGKVKHLNVEYMSTNVISLPISWDETRIITTK